MTTREERLAAFVRHVRLLIADVWPEGGTMYVSPCEKNGSAHPVQEPNWPTLRHLTQAPAAQSAPQLEERPALEQLHQAHLL